MECYVCEAGTDIACIVCEKYFCENHGDINGEICRECMQKEEDDEFL